MRDIRVEQAGADHVYRECPIGRVDLDAVGEFRAIGMDGQGRGWAIPATTYGDALKGEERLRSGEVGLRRHDMTRKSADYVTEARLRIALAVLPEGEAHRVVDLSDGRSARSFNGCLAKAVAGTLPPRKLRDTE